MIDTINFIKDRLIAFLFGAFLGWCLVACVVGTVDIIKRII